MNEAAWATQTHVFQFLLFAHRCEMKKKKYKQTKQNTIQQQYVASIHIEHDIWPEKSMFIMSERIRFLYFLPSQHFVYQLVHLSLRSGEGQREDRYI